MSCTISKALRAGVFPQVIMCIGAGSRENCYSFLLNPSLPKNQFQLLRSVTLLPLPLTLLHLLFCTTHNLHLTFINAA